MAGTFDQLLENLGVLPKEAPQFLGLTRTTYYRNHSVDFKRDYESISFLTKLLTACESLKKLKSKASNSLSVKAKLSNENINAIKKRIVILQASLYKLQDQLDTELTTFQASTNALELIDHVLNSSIPFTKAERARISTHRDELESRFENFTNIDFVLKTSKIRAIEAEIACLEEYVTNSMR